MFFVAFPEILHFSVSFTVRETKTAQFTIFEIRQKPQVSIYTKSHTPKVISSLSQNPQYISARVSNANLHLESHLIRLQIHTEFMYLRA